MTPLLGKFQDYTDAWGKINTKRGTLCCATWQPKWKIVLKILHSPWKAGKDCHSLLGKAVDLAQLSKVPGSKVNSLITRRGPEGGENRPGVRTYSGMSHRSAHYGRKDIWGNMVVAVPCSNLPVRRCPGICWFIFTVGKTSFQNIVSWIFINCKGKSI